MFCSTKAARLGLLAEEKVLVSPFPVLTKECFNVQIRRLKNYQVIIFQVIEFGICEVFCGHCLVIKGWSWILTSHFWNMSSFFFRQINRTFCGWWPRCSITDLDIKLQLHFVQLFALNLCLTTRTLKGKTNSEQLPPDPLFHLRAVKRSRGAAHRPCREPIPEQGVLGPSKMFCSPLKAAASNRLNCTKYSLLASAWTLFCWGFFSLFCI